MGHLRKKSCMSCTFIVIPDSGFLFRIPAVGEDSVRATTTVRRFTSIPQINNCKLLTFLKLILCYMTLFFNLMQWGGEAEVINDDF